LPTTDFGSSSGKFARLVPTPNKELRWRVEGRLSRILFEMPGNTIKHKYLILEIK